MTVNEYVLEDVEFIQHAARLLDDFEELNEHAYLPVIKILFDWMKINPDVLKMSGKVCLSIHLKSIVQNSISNCYWRSPCSIAFSVYLITKNQ